MNLVSGGLFNKINSNYDICPINRGMNSNLPLVVLDVNTQSSRIEMPHTVASYLLANLDSVVDYFLPFWVWDISLHISDVGG